MSDVPHSCQGRTFTPSGRTMMHSLFIRHSVRVNSRESSSWTQVMAMRFVGWLCITTRFSASAARREIWPIRWLGSSEVQRPPSV